MKVKTWTLWAAILLIFLFVIGCSRMIHDGLPTGITTDCPEGERKVIDCSKSFSQFATTLRADIGLVNSSAFGVGIGAQKLISLDTITGDLLAHRRQICVDYNNCILSREEYKEEMRYLRRAQLKIREAAYWSRTGSDTAPFGPASPPGIGTTDGGDLYEGEEYYPEDVGYEGDQAYNEYGTGTEGEPYADNPTAAVDQTFQDESQNTILNELSEVTEEIKTNSTEQVNNTRSVPLETQVEEPEPIGLEYSISVRRKNIPGEGTGRYTHFDFSPGMSLISGDQININFKTDADGYVYIVNFDSSGVPQLIFPHDDVGKDNNVTSGTQYRLPPDGYYELDNVTGAESIYFIAAPFKIPHVDNLVLGSEENRSINNSEDTVKIARAKGALNVLARGISRVVKEEEEKAASPVEESPEIQKPETGGEEVSERLGVTSIKVEFVHE